MFNLDFQYPWWFFLFCIALGTGYAMLLYYKDKTFDRTHQHRWLRPSLFAFRLLAATIIASLLLSPLLKYSHSEVEKPVIAVLRDASGSIPMVLKGKQLDEYNSGIKDIASALGGNYDVQFLNYGDGLHEVKDDTLRDKSTDISTALQDVYTRFENRNLGAIILAGDGIYNRGSNPLYLPKITSAPIYTIAVGDTTIRRDLAITRVNYNKVIYLGNSFSLQVFIEANSCQGENTQLSLVQVGDNNEEKKLFEKGISITSNAFSSSQEVVLNADKAGVQHYQLRVSEVKDEMTVLNNVKDIYVEVKEAKEKVLIVGDAPHPDIAAMRDALTTNRSYVVDIKFQPDYNVNPDDYSVIICHQVPAGDAFFMNFFNKLKQLKKPVIFITGSQTITGAFNSIQNGIKISNGNGNTDVAQASLNRDFSLFTLSEPTRQKMEMFPPLITLFGEYRSSANLDILLYQKIGTVNTKFPLIAFDQSADQKFGYIEGEGIWRWKTYDYLQNKSHDAFNELMTRVVNYMAIKPDKKQFRVTLQNASGGGATQVFGENEPVLFNAELYNEAYELINQPDVKLNITDKNGKEYPFVFNKTFNAYSLNVGSFPAGRYRWSATVEFNNRKLAENGSFTISPVQLEAINLTADYRLMHQLSERSGGKMFYLSQVGEIKNIIGKNEAVKPVIYNIDKTEAVINLKWLFFLILAMISIEWFLRKYYGAY